MSYVDLEMLPAATVARTLSAPTGALRRLAATLLTWHQRARMRRRLLSLDDRMLQDIGVTRADVHSETEKPFWRA